MSRPPSYATHSAGEPVQTLRARSVEVRPAPIVVLCYLGICVSSPTAGCKTPLPRTDERAVPEHTETICAWSRCSTPGRAGCSVLDRESLLLTSTPRDWLSLIDLLSPNGLCCWRGVYAAPGPGERLSRGQHMLNATPRRCGKDNRWNKKRRLLDSSKRLNANTQAGDDKRRRMIQLAPK